MTETWRNHFMAEAQWVLARCSYGLVNYRHPARARSLQGAKEARAGVYTSTTPLECSELFGAIRACQKVPGDIAEVGVFLGGTARLLLSASDKRLHLFDTFEGLPHKEGAFEKGEWAGSLQDVKRNLKAFEERLEFHAGFFPQSAVGLEDLQFSFVHLDLDLYTSTIAALQWFWPRMNPGGILLSHDFPLSDGVVQAFLEFFADRPEPFIPLSGNQCLAVKA